MKRFLCIFFLLYAVTTLFAQTNFVIIGSSTNSVKLGWCPSPSVETSHYSIAWGTGNVTGWTPDIRDTNYPPCGRPILQAGSNWFRAYTTNINVGNVTNCTIVGLLSGVKYYFTVIAESSFGDQSPPSNEIEHEILVPSTNSTPSSPQDFKFYKP